MDSSYISFYSYPLTVSSNRSTTDDYSSSTYYPDNPATNPSNISIYSNIRSDRCLVCNDRSSGIHFGVSTCEACKAFFRRTSLSTCSIPPACSPDRCEINIKNRNNCPSCRFDKCKRLGMARENVIYGKPSKQTIQNSSFYDQNSLIEKLTMNLNELIQLFENIHSIDNKQSFERFTYLTCQMFYQQTISQIDMNFLTDIIHRIVYLLFNSYKNTHLVKDYCLNLRVILILWLFVYYYEIFILKKILFQKRN